MNLTKDGKLTRVINATAAGTTDVNSSVVDMKGFGAVAFLVGFGAITASAVTSIKAQQGTESDGSDMADLSGTAISVADDDDDNQIVALEIRNPRERYIRVVVDRGTANAVVDFGVAIQTGRFEEPLTHDTTTVLGSELHQAPAEGTAL